MAAPDGPRAPTRFTPQATGRLPGADLLETSGWLTGRSIQSFAGWCEERSPASADDGTLSQQCEIAFGIAEQLRLVMFVIAPDQGDTGRCDDQAKPSERSCDTVKGMAQQITAGPEYGRPCHSAHRVEKQKSPRRETTGASQHGREHAEQRDETGQKHDLAAVPPEQILAQIELALVQTYQGSPPEQYLAAEAGPEPVA